MPRPVFILVANEVLIEDNTAVSCIRLLTGITQERYPEAEEPKEANKKQGWKRSPLGQNNDSLFTLVSLWQREPHEDNEEFKSEIVLRLPGLEPEVLWSDDLKWKTLNHRVVLRFTNFKKAKESGIVDFEHRIRTKSTDDNDWVSQKYRVNLELREPASAKDKQPRD